MPYWYEYAFRVQPHHTDYSGVVWHGTYVEWMESLRVECLRSHGFPFEAFVEAGYDLPVVDLHLRYHQPLRLGMAGIVKGRAKLIKGVRICWQYEIWSESDHHPDHHPTADHPRTERCVTGQVTLVPIDRAKQKIARRLPEPLKRTLEEIAEYFDAE